MNVLYICTHSPYETKSGAHQRTHLIFNALCSLAEVDVVCFSDDRRPDKTQADKILYWGSPPSGDRKSVWSLVWFWRRSFIFPVNPEWARVVRDILAQKHYDRIFVRHINNALACDLTVDGRVLIDADDLPEEHFATAARRKGLSIVRRLYYRFAERLARHHTNVPAQRCRRLFLAKQGQCTRPGFVWLPNLPIFGAVSAISPEIPSDKTIFSVGLLSYAPNHEGMARFLGEIWPRIRQAHPDAIMRIAGNGLPVEMQKAWERLPGVFVLGFVPDLATEYNRCRAVVASIYQGSGTNIKVLEALQVGRPCVLSCFAGRGLEDLLVDGQTAMIARDDAEFAEKVSQLIENKELSKRIASNAQRAIGDYLQKHSVSEIIARHL